MPTCHVSCACLFLSVVQNNTAGTDGGGISVARQTGPVEIRNCIFKGNRASQVWEQEQLQRRQEDLGVLQVYLCTKDACMSDRSRGSASCLSCRAVQFNWWPRRKRRFSCPDCPSGDSKLHLHRQFCRRGNSVHRQFCRTGMGAAAVA